MGLFQNLSQTPTFGDAVYPKYGRYFVRIAKVSTKQNRKRMLQIFAEYTVLAVLPSNEPPPQHYVGEEAGQCFHGEYAQPDWAGFISGMFGCKVTDLDNADVRLAFGNRDSDDWACNENPQLGAVQPMRGMLGEMYNRMSMSADKPGNASHPFTRTRWVRSVPASEVAAAMKADEIARLFPGGVPA